MALCGRAEFIICPLTGRKTPYYGKDKMIYNGETGRSCATGNADKKIRCFREEAGDGDWAKTAD
jgi:hypothetical protein